LSITEMLKQLPTRQLAVLSLFAAYSVILLIVRILLSGKGTYTFLCWNLFLAWVPLGFALLLNRWAAASRSGWLALALVGGWLLFFPNAPYILTDLFHLRPRAGVPYWLDLALLLSFGLSGLMVGLVSLHEVQQYLSRKFRPAVVWGMVGLAVAGGSFGIYLGRYLRWNSWDLMTHPRAVLADVAGPFLHPLAHKESVAMTLAFAALIMLGYLSMRILKA
jgi:uncharacterized membrane protein